MSFGPVKLVWPPSTLSGHNSGAWYKKSKVVKKHRRWAYWATLEFGEINLPSTGDIAIRFRFVPPDRRGDRTNFANRLKPAIDGIAEALEINDKRFLPTYEYATPEYPGCVEVWIG